MTEEKGHIRKAVPGDLEAVNRLLGHVLAVHHCGRHIGTALFHHVQSYAKQLGCHNITLHVWACNPSARAFYDSLGLQPQYTSMEILC